MKNGSEKRLMLGCECDESEGVSFYGFSQGNNNKNIYVLIL